MHALTIVVCQILNRFVFLQNEYETRWVKKPNRRRTFNWLQEINFNSYNMSYFVVLQLRGCWLCCCRWPGACSIVLYSYIGCRTWRSLTASQWWTRNVPRQRCTSPTSRWRSSLLFLLQLIQVSVVVTYHVTRVLLRWVLSVFYLCIAHIM